jgi:hypothetical protein
MMADRELPEGMKLINGMLWLDRHSYIVEPYYGSNPAGFDTPWRVCMSGSRSIEMPKGGTSAP